MNLALRFRLWIKNIVRIITGRPNDAKYKYEVTQIILDELRKQHFRNSRKNK